MQILLGLPQSKYSILLPKIAFPKLDVEGKIPALTKGVVVGNPK